MKSLTDRLGWPGLEYTEEGQDYVVKAWMVDLCGEARTAIIELTNMLERMSIGADQMAAETNNGMCDALINDSRKLVDKYRG